MKQIAVLLVILLFSGPAFPIVTTCGPAAQCGGGGTGGSGGTSSCTVTTYCYTGSTLTGSVSCSSSTNSCSRGPDYVVCNNQKTEC